MGLEALYLIHDDDTAMYYVDYHHESYGIMVMVDLARAVKYYNP